MNASTCLSNFSMFKAQTLVTWSWWDSTSAVQLKLTYLIFNSP